MSFSSLQSKIFVLMTVVLLIAAITVMTTSRRDVSETVIASEQHAIDNVLDLIHQESMARWATLLDNKVSIVRHGRHQLMQTGKIIEKTLMLYADQAKQGIITTDSAKKIAKQWINQLHFDGDHYAFAFNEKNIVIASGAPFMIGLDLSSTRDFKNRLLATAVLNESKDSGYSFALYHRPSGTKNDNFRYAYFGYFKPWDWVFAVSDSAAHVITQIDEHRAQMEQSVRTTVLPLQPTESGFVFIITHDGRFIVEPPSSKTTILDGIFADGTPLLEHLTNIKTDLEAARIQSSQGVWQINSRQYAPLGWTIVAAVPEDDITAPARALLRTQAMIFSTMLILILFITWLFSAHIVRPLKRLTQFARQWPDQALQPNFEVPHHIIDLPKKHNDEVGRLATAFMYMDHKLRENITHLMRETAVRERFESELNIARSIQLGLLPPPFSDNAHLIDLSALMRPAKEVGGDIYDYFFLSNKKLCLVIGDVSDKGVPAALFMAVTRTLIRAIAEDEIEPERMIKKLNERLSENNPHMMFVTLIIGTLDLKTGDFAWVNAGHLAPLIIQPNQKIRTLQGRSGPACGIQEGASYHTFKTTLEPNEILFGYTDGVTESLNHLHEQYGDKAFHKFLINPHRSATDLIEKLLQDLDEFTADTEQADDITVLAIKRL
jgi:sigma-B regulation protein RsbU (phosphoserine phosphatase)